MFPDICSIYLIDFTIFPFYGERKPLNLSVRLVAQEGLANCPHFSCWLVACFWLSWGHRCPFFLELICDVTCPVAQGEAIGHSSSSLPGWMSNPCPVSLVSPSLSLFFCETLPERAVHRAWCRRNVALLSPFLGSPLLSWTSHKLCSSMF